MRVEYFIELAVDVEPEKTKKEIIKGLKEEVKKQRKTGKEFDEKHIGKALIEGAIDATSLLVNLESLFMPENAIYTALTNLVKSVLSE